MNTDTQQLTDLEAQLDECIPCGGIKHPKVARSCDREAVLMSRGHGCKIGPERFKCLDCWKGWYQFVATGLAAGGVVICRRCGGLFYRVEDFSDYRPF